jgi:hypothetical protein
MQPLPKTVLSWLVAALGCFVGLFALARFGARWLPLGDRDSGWFLPWVTFAGVGLFGAGFLVGSITAPRHPRRAGMIFLAFLPITAFCLAYPESGFLVWHEDGGGWFETPLPLTAIGLTAVFFLPFVAPLFTLRDKKRAAIVFAITASAAVPVFIHSRWTSVLIPHLLAYSLPFPLFGLFWLGTHRLGWAVLLQPRPRSVAGRTAGIAVTFLVVLCLDIAMTLGLAALGSSLFSGDCSGKPPITHPESPRHAVFTARVIFVGRSIEALTRAAGLRSLGAYDRRVGDWAIGVVQERFWGAPSHWPHLVLMTNFIYWKGETYFIDGSRENGLITRILPIVEARISCSRSRPAQDAIVDLRVLRQAPPAGGARLIGYVREPKVFTGVFGPPSVPNFAADAKIDVTGPAGTKTITTDPAGIYQVDGLPPGDYTLLLAAPDKQVAGVWDHEGSPAKVHLDSNRSVEYNFDLFWNGRIEGHVKDDSGKPARIWVMLLSGDGRNLPGNVRFFLKTDPDGSYQINKIPPGRYIVMVNPDGPYDEGPYNVQYYRSALHAEEAQRLELSAGQQIRGIDFTVPHLAERMVQVRVTWPNGSGTAGASICVAYEHTKNFGSLSTASRIKDADQNGLGVIHVYGNSRVRLFAAQLVDNEKEKRTDTYYSRPVEAEASKVPEKLDLVLTSPKP